MQKEIQQQSNQNSENNHQKFTIFCGTYEGAILGLGGDLTNLSLKYAFKPSTNSLKSMDVTGKYLVVGGFDEYVRIYDLRRQRECGVLEGHAGTITSLKCHKSITFSSGEDGYIMVWKMKEFALLHKLKEHKVQVNDIAIHESGKILVSISKDQKLFIWNLLNATKAYSMNLKYNAYRIEITKEYIIVMSDQSLHVIDQQTNKELFSLKQQEPVNINDFCIYNNKYALVGDNNGFIFIWDLETQNYISLKAHQSRVKKLKIANIDQIDVIVSISTNGEICLFDTLIIFKDFEEISQNQELKDVKPIYQIETLNRLNCLTIYMDLAAEKQKEEQQQEDTQEEQIKQQNELLKKKKIVKQQKVRVKIIDDEDEKKSKQFFVGNKKQKAQNKQIKKNNQAQQESNQQKKENKQEKKESKQEQENQKNQQKQKIKKRVTFA